MNTLLSSAQEADFEQFRSFAQEQLAPVVDKLVTHEACLKQFMQKLGQRGFLGLNIPKEYGGQGGALLETVLLVQALAEVEPGLGITIGNHAAVVEVLKRFGSDQQRSKYLPLLARGELFATLAFSEEKAGTDFEAVQATASGVQEMQLTASKRWVVTGDFAGLFLVLAKSDNGDLVTLLADRPADGASFSLRNERKMMGMRSAYINDIEFKALKVSADNRIAAGGADVALHAMDVAKVVLAAAGVGLLDGSTNAAVEHARQREQFGANIGHFQGVQWKLADMECERAASTLMVYRAAWSHDQEPERFRQHASMCKWYAARAARVHSGEALQIMGAIGLEEDMPLARFYDDAKMLEIAQGTSEFQKMLLVKELNI